MSVIERAIGLMESWAADDSHGYDQQYRWGERGDYDCSAAVIDAWQRAGVPVKSNGATYTGNMRGVLLSCGFIDVTSYVDLNSGKGLVRGDVLLNYLHHTAMFCGDGFEVEASINENGSTTGGQPGDQTGREFLKRSYRNYPWDCVLRYAEAPDSEEAETEQEPEEERQSFGTPFALTLHELSRGSMGAKVKALQDLLIGNDISVGPDGADGDFGPNTEKGVICYQSLTGLVADGIAGHDTFKNLLGGE